jgi:hypothetical protein
MKRFYFLLAALALPLAAQAAAPPCWKPWSQMYVRDAATGTEWEYVAAWLCGDGPTTVPVVEFFTRTELLRFAPAFLAGTPDAAALTAAYNADPRPRNAAALAQERRIRVNLFGAPPVASEGVAYKQRLAPGTVNPITYVAIGTLPKTTLCVRVDAAPNTAGSFMPVPREAVKLYSPRDVFPVVVYALCS